MQSHLADEYKADVLLDLREFGFAGGAFASPPYAMDVDSTRFILSGRAYPLVSYIEEPGTIIDCGGNSGATACYFARAYPQAQIFSFEPSARSFAYFRRNTSAFPNVKGFPFGLSDSEQEVALFRGRDSTVTQSIYSNSYTIERTEPVRLRRAASVLSELGVSRVDILKLDTQGAEVLILRSLSALIPSTSLIYVEHHSEDDRVAIDHILNPTHIVVSARQEIPHIGELCYVNKSRYWSAGNLAHYEIARA